MENFSVIKDITIILALSLPILYVFKKIRISPIVGFLFTGIILGPSGFGIISHTGQIEVMAEVGIILLMFSIGLEFSFAKLVKMKRYLLVSGNLQFILTFLAAFAVLLLLGVSSRVAALIAMLVILSSTAIVLKVYSDKNLLDSPHGKIGVGILIFQDLSIILLLVILPLLAPGADLNISGVMLKVFTALLIIAGIIAISRFVMPRLLYLVSSMQIREVFTAAMIVLLLGTAYITHAIGISFSIGAFIAGFIIAESDFAHEITAEILPFRDVFNSLFFVSAGLMLSLSSLRGQWALASALCLSVIALKFVIVFLVVKMQKYPTRVAYIAGLSLAQVGEFAFVLAQSAVNLQILNGDMYNMFLSVAIVTMIITPFMIELSVKLIRPEGKEAESVSPGHKSPGLHGHTIIVGYGLNGRNLVSVLKQTGIQYIIVELNPQSVKEAKKNNEPILYGDVTKKDILIRAGIRNAKIIVFAISDPGAQKIGLTQAKKLNPAVHCIVRTRYVNEVNGLLRMKADTVIPEEFETSLQIFSTVLQMYHIPLNVIMRQINMIRHGSYAMLRMPEEGISAMHLLDVISQSVTETYFVQHDSPAIGKTLKELNLRAVTGANVLAIVRAETPINTPAGSEQILAGDTLVLTGTHQAVDTAIDLLNSGN